MSAGVRLLPNAVTVVALCSGLSAVYFALSGRFELCVAAGGIAALCDALDGRLARMLDASSRIGAELDSLSDLVSFGVAPALVMYIWALQGTRLGWVVALVFAVCMALRLARFNTLLDVDQPLYAKEFFVGVPAPAAALLSGLPLYATLHFGRRLVVLARARGGVGGGRRRADGEPPADVVVQDRAGACAAGRAAAGDGRAGRRGAGDGAVPRAGHRGAGLPGDDPVHDAPPPLARRAPGGVERADAGAAGVGAFRPLGAPAGAAVAVAAAGGGAGERHGPGGPAFR
jgi:CDP-diacylglycerol--serine O-phosphatidyltransferase